MNKIQSNKIGDELIQTIKIERLKLEASLNSQITLALKMANSPLIQRYFLNPTDTELQKIALEELAEYRKTFASNSIFWVNDIDKKFYSDESYAYTVDTADTNNYWYMMTFNGKEKYNFNINYNPDLNVTNLWINALVFDSHHKPIGIVGTGVNLSDFIDTVYQKYSGTAELYFFRVDGEITGAKNVAFVENKKNITEVLGQTGEEILDKTKELKIGKEIEYYFEAENKQIIAVGSIPALSWYIIAVRPIIIGSSLRDMAVFFGIMMAIILSILVFFNIFIARTPNSLNQIGVKMRNKKLNFKIKVLIPILAIFIVSNLINLFNNYRLLNSSLEVKSHANMEIFIDSILAQIRHLNIVLDVTKQTLIEKHIAIAKTVVEILDNTPGELSSEKLLQISEPLDIIELSVADSNGIITASSVPKYIGFDYKLYEPTKIYMKLTDGTLTVLSEEPRASVLNDDVGDLVLGNINHYTGIARKNGGFIQIGFNASVIGKIQEEINIQKTIKETKFGQTGFGMVLSNGFITAHPNGDTSDVSGEDWYKTVSSGNGFVWLNIDGKKYHAGYKNENGNTILALETEHEFRTERNRLFLDTVISLFITLIIIIAVINIFIEATLEPLNRTIKKINQTFTDLDLKSGDNKLHKNEAESLGDFLHLTIVDQITGIYNRRYLDGSLKKLIKLHSRTGSNLSLLMIDIDYFKRYNDTYGHGMGDNCLKSVASALSQCVVRDEDFIARYGGEEFTVVLPNTDMIGAQVVAEKLLEKIRECEIPHKASEVADYVTISIGGTTGIVNYSQNPQDYIKAADKALYESKKNGRNRYTFEDFPTI
ncbi:MAG: diguanylate cyclase [Fibromonadaceae bacterium]|nr:diguanylate cyclase [Fibromonadaceae bacterium]